MMGSQSLVSLNLNIGDQLTSISCGHVVAELIKFLSYQRLQIPYTYQWLKQVISNRKLCENNQRKESFHSEKHYRVASTCLSNLDLILKSVLQEINGVSMPEEVCIALGATPVTCREVYRLLLPTLCHRPQCHSSHIANDQKIQRNVFRTLVTSESLNNVFYSQIPPTNMFVFIKKKLINQEAKLSCDNFVMASGCRLPRNCRIVVIDFRARNQENLSCCNDFQVFGDVISEDLVNLQLNEDDKDDDLREIESTNDMKWFQSCYVMKGFKDCIVNGASVTNSWLEA